MTIWPDERLEPSQESEPARFPLTFSQLRQSLRELQHTWITMGGERDLFISPNFETLTPFFWEELLEMVKKLEKGEVDRGEVADFFITAENIILTLLLAGQEDKTELSDSAVTEFFTRLQRAKTGDVSTGKLVDAGREAYLALIPDPGALEVNGEYFDRYAQADEHDHRDVFNDLLSRLNQIPAEKYQRHYQEQRDELLVQMARLYRMGLDIAQANGMTYEEVLDEKKTKTLVNILRWERPVRVGGGDKEVLRDRMLYMLRRLDFLSRRPEELIPIRSERPMSNYPLERLSSRYPQVEMWRVLQAVPQWDDLSVEQRCQALADNFEKIVGSSDPELQAWLRDRAKTFGTVELLLKRVETEWETLDSRQRYQIVVDFLRKLREDVKFDDMVLKQG